MSSIFGRSQPRPTPRPVASMPDPESPDVVEARRREIGKRLDGGGRTSTILTGGGSRSAPSTGYDTFASPTL